MQCYSNQSSINHETTRRRHDESLGCLSGRNIHTPRPSVGLPENVKHTTIKRPSCNCSVPGMQGYRFLFLFRFFFFFCRFLLFFVPLVSVARPVSVLSELFWSQSLSSCRLWSAQQEQHGRWWQEAQQAGTKGACCLRQHSACSYAV